MWVRLGLRPTASISIAEPSMAAAAQAKNAADEMSPGTSISRPTSRCPPVTLTTRPSRPTSTPKARNARSVWSRVADGSRTLVRPSACRPASRTALLTCALGTSGP